jgi:hypothetical protein
MISEALPVIVASGEGEKLYAFGEEVIVHLGGAQTGGRTALWTEITQEFEKKEICSGLSPSAPWDSLSNPLSSLSLAGDISK